MDEFAEKLAALATLTDEDLTNLQSEITAAFDAADQAADDALMASLAEALDQVAAELAKRAEGGGEEEAPAEAMPAAVVEPQLVAAVEENNDVKEGDPVEQQTGGALTVPRDREPVTVAPTSTVVAGADIPGYSAGTVIPTLKDFADAFTKRIRTLHGLSGGTGEKVVVASIKTKAPEDRILYNGDLEGNKAKIEAVTSTKAIVAAGGCCAPLETRYDLYTIGDTDRPVRGALPGFQADRGGIRYFQGPKLSDVTGGVAVWTCDDDEAVDPADELTWKVCIRADCPPEQTAEVQAITMCIKFGVLQSRIFPEMVTANTQMLRVQQARFAESVLLAQIKSLSKLVTGPAVAYGAIRDFIRTVHRAAAYLRDVNRLVDNERLHAIIPSWFRDLMVSDSVTAENSTARLSDNYSMSEAELNSILNDLGITVTWSLDTWQPTTSLPAADAGGGATTAPPGGFYLPFDEAALATPVPLPDFPSQVQWALYPEGSLLLLDGGTLDLGLIRDSTLVRTNDYMQFSEIFESVANVGGLPLWITSPLDDTGYCCAGAATP